MRGRVRLITTAITAVLALAFLLQGAVAGAAPGRQPPQDERVTLSIGATPAYNLSDLFWGTTVSSHARLLNGEGSLVSATPATVAIYPGGNAGDEYDPLNDSQVTLVRQSVNGTEVATESWEHPPTGETDFIEWCRSVSCTAFLQVPAEINNATLAAAIVNYTENDLGFHPAYWVIGNEPELWKNWNREWVNWTAAYSEVTPAEYATMVGNYSAAMRAVDPSIKIIGLAATGGADGSYPLTDWVNATVDQDGSKINAVSFHEYPTPKRGKEALTVFYSSLSETGQSLPSRLAQARTAIAASPYPNIPVFVTEVGSGLSRQWSGPDSRTFPGGLSLASQTIEAMDLNVTNLDVFATELNTSNSWFNFQGYARPDYTVYSDLLSHLGSEVYPVGLSSNLSSTIYSVATVSPLAESRSDLLIVNDNVTTNISAEPVLPGIPQGAPAEVWTWAGNVETNGTNLSLPYVAPATPEPVAEFYPGGLPANLTVPPQSIVLCEAYPGGSAQLYLVASGLPSSTRWWFANVDGREYESSTDTMSLLVPDGTTTVSASNLTFGTYENSTANTWERVGAPEEREVVASNDSLYMAMPFSLQWHLNASALPAKGGQITGAVEWADSGLPLTLDATPAPGWFFDRWFGWGNGSVSNATASGISITPATGHIDENATFVPAYNVTFLETGLPFGTNWSVSLNGHLTSNTTRKTTAQQVLTFQAANGTWGYNVTPPLGFAARPAAGSVNMTGGPVSVTIAFAPGRPAPRLYPVVLRESGLPQGSNWSVSVRGGAPNYSTSEAIVLHESNGTYGFTVGYVQGYHPNPLRDAFTVNGTEVSAPAITFLQNRTPGPTLYSVVWQEMGLGPKPNWTVEIAGVGTVASNGSWVSDRLPNGTYQYTIPGTGTATPEVDEGTVVVQGSAHTVSVVFQIGRTVILPPHPSWTQGDNEALIVAGLIFGGIILIGLAAWAAQIIVLRHRGCPDVSNHHLHTSKEKCGGQK
jgi:hypothetical protein